MNAAAALKRALARWRVVDVEATTFLAARLPAGCEAERLEQRCALLRRRGVRADAREATDAVLVRDVGRVCRQRLVAGVVDEQLEPKALRILERQRAVRARPADARLPERERLLRPDAEADGVDHAVSGPARGGARI